MSLTKLIPGPTQRLPERQTSQQQEQQQQPLVAVQAAAPPYGHRRGWTPRRVEDFGDGGAFPEIHSRQYPLGMGQPQSASAGRTLPMTLGADGRVNFDAVVRQGQRADKVVHSKFTDLLPKPIDEADPSFQRPDDETVKDITEKTREALSRLVESKAAASNPVRSAERTGPAQFIRYTPSQQGAGYNSGSAQRIVRMVEAQKDPMEPPRFRISSKVPRGPPSPPATVMHSPPRKVSSKEQAEWKVPPCLSNWKNPKGYTIPLDKRVAADGRGLQTVHLNEKFVMLAEALHTAEVKSREAVAMRAKVESRVQQIQKDRHEEELLRIASRARGERAGLAVPAEAEAEDGATSAEARERDALRRDRAEVRAQERNRQRAAGGGAGDRDRDISEQIALGRPALQRNQQDPEAAFDSRLFNRDAGLASGFHAGEDEIYNVYDKPWREAATTAGQLYRPTRGRGDADDEDDVGRLTAGAAGRFVAEQRSGGGGRRDGPVQFEKQVEDDPFELDDFLDKVKRSENPADQASGSGGGGGSSAGHKRSAGSSSQHHHDGPSGRKRDRRD